MSHEFWTDFAVNYGKNQHAGDNVPDASIVERVRKPVLEGYESIRPLSEKERGDSVPAFQILSHIGALARISYYPQPG